MPSVEIIGPDDMSPVIAFAEEGKIVPVGDHYAALDHNGSVVGVVQQHHDDEWKRWSWRSIDGTSCQDYTALDDALNRAGRYVGAIR